MSIFRTRTKLKYYKRFSTPPCNNKKHLLQQSSELVYKESYPSKGKFDEITCDIGKWLGDYMVVVMVKCSKHPGPTPLQY